MTEKNKLTGRAELTELTELNELTELTELTMLLMMMQMMRLLVVNHKRLIGGYVDSANSTRHVCRVTSAPDHVKKEE